MFRRLRLRGRGHHFKIFVLHFHIAASFRDFVVGDVGQVLDQGVVIFQVLNDLALGGFYIIRTWAMAGYLMF